MLMKSYHFLFISTLIMGTVVAVSANSWFTAWAGLEINLMSMIPLIIISVNSKLSEGAMKYFLVQALASTIMLLSANMNTPMNYQMTLIPLDLLLFSALIMKAGIPPLHLWFPQIIKFLNWNQALVLLTWQKVAPLLLLSAFNMNWVTLVSAVAALVGALGALNQMYMKPLLAYSSIAHSSWMLMAAFSNTLSWLIYFLIYTLISVSVIFPLFKNNLNKIKSLFSWHESTTNKNLFIFLLLTLGGLPPFMGFMAKLSIISLLLTNYMAHLTIILLLSSLISLYFYFRLSYNMSLSKKSRNKMNEKSKNNKLKGFLSFMTAMNILTPLISFIN